MPRAGPKSIPESTMNQATSAQAEFDALDKEYRKYIDEIRSRWLVDNRVKSKDVYEVMSPEDREEVHRRIAYWRSYITPFAESWWKERGYGVVWPECDSSPMQVYKLEMQQS